jgi:hypothetical protein
MEFFGDAVGSLTTRDAVTWSFAAQRWRSRSIDLPCVCWDAKLESGTIFLKNAFNIPPIPDGFRGRTYSLA